MEQFGTNIASALVGLATNQKFNFSLMILTGMLGHISNGTPFLMYPSIVLSSCRDYTFDSIYVRGSHCIGRGGKKHSTSPHSRSLQVLQGMLKGQLQLKCCSFSTLMLSTKVLLPFKRTVPLRGLRITKMRLRHLEEMKGLLDNICLNRKLETQRQTLSQAKQIIKLKAKP
ncbi:hypothetical protein Tco_0060523 [Tanacetum coccineum]